MSKDQESVIQVRDVRAGYGRNDALHRISVTLEPGSIYALLGRNGAGKSTLIRCLLGQMKVRAGKVTILGLDAWRHRQTLMDRIGVVPEEPDLPPTMRIHQVSEFLGQLYSSWDNAGLLERLDRWRVDKSAVFGALSRGQKTRVALAFALASKPKVLVLDDPTIGLDAVARRSFFEELSAELAEHPMTVLIASHDLAGLESFADTIGILSEGRMLLEEPLEDLKARFRRIAWPGEPSSLPLDSLGAIRVQQKPWGTEALVSRFDQDVIGHPDGLSIGPVPLEDLFIALTDQDREVSV